MSVSNPRRPILTQEILDALRIIARVPLRDVIVPTDFLRRILNDRDDWIETIEEQRKKIRDLEIGATS